MGFPPLCEATSGKLQLSSQIMWPACLELSRIRNEVRYPAAGDNNVAVRGSLGNVCMEEKEANRHADQRILFGLKGNQSIVAQGQCFCACVCAAHAHAFAFGCVGRWMLMFG